MDDYARFLIALVERYDGDASTLNVRDFKKLMDRHPVKKPIWLLKPNSTIYMELTAP